jgi:hypothetical protein
MIRLGNRLRDKRWLLWLAPVVSVVCFGCPVRAPEARVEVIGIGELGPGMHVLELSCTPDSEAPAAESFWITTDDDDVLMSIWTEASGLSRALARILPRRRSSTSRSVSGVATRIRLPGCGVRGIRRAVR